MKIIIDIDGILLDYIDGFSAFMWSEYKIHLTKKDIDHFDLSKCETLGFSKEDSKKYQIEFSNAHYFNELPAIDGSQEGIDSLSKNHRLVIATYRNNILRERTNTNLECRFPGAFNQIYFCHHPEKPKDGYISKLDVAFNENARIAIEDAPDFVNDYTNNGIHVIVLKQNWNMLFFDKERADFTKSELIHPVDHWIEIPSKVDEIDLLLNSPKS